MNSNSNNQNGNTEIEVLFEDNHLLVVNKPALLPTMGVEADEDSLYRRVGEYLKVKYNKPGNVYVGVVSRLDAHTSGAIVLARTSKAASRLSDQIRRGAIEKRYFALIPAGLVPPQATLADRLVKNESLHRMQVVPENAATVANEKTRITELPHHRSNQTATSVGSGSSDRPKAPNSRSVGKRGIPYFG